MRGFIGMSPLEKMDYYKKRCKTALHTKNKAKNAGNLQKQEKKSPKIKKSTSADKKLLRQEFKNQQKMPTAMGIGVG